MTKKQPIEQIKPRNVERHLAKDNLPAITFSGLARPARSWSCGHESLITNPGSYLERVTSLCGPSDEIAELVKIIVDATERRVGEIVSGGGKTPNIGIGWWQGETWDLLIYMEVSGEKPAIPLVDILNSNLDLMAPLYVLRGVDHPMWGCTDTFWALAEIGHLKPEKRDAAFDLALRLCNTYIMRGEELAEGEEDCGPRAPYPSEILELTKDIYAYLDTVAVWDNARNLDRATQANTTTVAEVRRI